MSERKQKSSCGGCLALLLVLLLIPVMVAANSCSDLTKRVNDQAQEREDADGR